MRHRSPHHLSLSAAQYWVFGVGVAMLVTGLFTRHRGDWTEDVIHGDPSLEPGPNEQSCSIQAAKPERRRMRRGRT